MHRFLDLPASGMPLSEIERMDRRLRDMAAQPLRRNGSAILVRLPPLVSGTFEFRHLELSRMLPEFATTNNSYEYSDEFQVQLFTK